MLWGYTAVAGGATVENVTLNVTLTDEQSLRQKALQAESDSLVCESVGALPGQFAVTVGGTVDDKRYPWQDRYKYSDSYEIAATIGENTGTSLTDVEVEDGGSEDFFAVISVENDGSVEPGDDVTVTVSLRKGGETHDSVTRTATVEERELDCESR